jgi:hypothetical protein
MRAEAAPIKAAKAIVFNIEGFSFLIACVAWKFRFTGALNNPHRAVAAEHHKPMLAEAHGQSERGASMQLFPFSLFSFVAAAVRGRMRQCAWLVRTSTLLLQR